MFPILIISLFQLFNLISVLIFFSQKAMKTISHKIKIDNIFGNVENVHLINSLLNISPLRWFLWPDSSYNRKPRKLPCGILQENFFGSPKTFTMLNSYSTQCGDSGIERQQGLQKSIQMQKSGETLLSYHKQYKIPKVIYRQMSFSHMTTLIRMALHELAPLLVQLCGMLGRYLMQPINQYVHAN